MHTRPHAQRDIVASLGFMASPVGNALGVSIAPLIVTTTTTTPSDDTATGVHGMTAFMAGQLALAGAATVWAWWALQDRPPTPPSHAAALEIEAAAKEARRRARPVVGGMRRRRWWSSWAGVKAAVAEGWKAGWAPVRACCQSGRDFRVLLWCFGIGCVSGWVIGLVGAMYLRKPHTKPLTHPPPHTKPGAPSLTPC